MDRETRSLFICLVAIIGVVIGSILCFGLVADYWSGSAKASIIEKQTGVKYTWREAAQFKTIYDAQNVRVVFERCEEN